MSPHARTDDPDGRAHADDLRLTSLLLAKQDALRREADKLGEIVTGIRQAQAQGRTESEIAAMFAGTLTPRSEAAAEGDDASHARRFTTQVDGTRTERACWDLTISGYRGGPHNSAIELGEADLEHIADSIRDGALEGELLIERAPEGFTESEERAPEGFTESEPREPVADDDLDTEQVGHAWRRRFVRDLPGGEYAVIDVFFFARSVPDGPDVMTRRLDYVVCGDPDEPSSTEVWSDARYDDVPTGPHGAHSGQAQRLCEEFDPTTLTWDGRPTRASRPLPVPPLPSAPDGPVAG